MSPVAFYVLDVVSCFFSYCSCVGNCRNSQLLCRSLRACSVYYYCLQCFVTLLVSSWFWAGDYCLFSSCLCYPGCCFVALSRNWRIWGLSSSKSAGVSVMTIHAVWPSSLLCDSLTKWRWLIWESSTRWHKLWPFSLFCDNVTTWRWSIRIRWLKFCRLICGSSKTGHRSWAQFEIDSHNAQWHNILHIHVGCI